MIDEKQFLKDFREAVKTLKCKLVLDRGYRLRFFLGKHDKDGYDSIALVCVYRKQIYYPHETRKAAKLIKIRKQLFDEINRAADRHPVSYSRPLRRQLMRAAGLWK